MSKAFQFAKISQLEQYNFDNSLEGFRRNGVEGTIKENLQNSLDARLYKDFEKPVVVTIRNTNVRKSDLPGIEELFEHIYSMEGQNEYTKETVEFMQSKYELETIPVISFEDENTKGLTGANNGQTDNPEDTYGIYAYKKGFHSVSKDKDHEITRGGSHGIGKIANNAASEIHLMYFANCDAENNQHLGGSVHLIEHEYNGQGYRSTGYYTDVMEDNGDTKFVPFKNLNNHKVFNKDTRGLKIIIPYVREELTNKNSIIKAICDNYFLAILDQKLIVNYYDEKNELTVIDHENLEILVNNPEVYEVDYEEIREHFTPIYVDTYLNEQKHSITVDSRDESYNFDIYFKYDESIRTGRLAILRTIGMKIEDFKVKGNVRKPFNAILIGGMKEDNYLKSLENESHTAISAEDIRDKEENRNAVRFINNLNKKMAELINEYFEKANPTEGELDTGDILFTTESNFTSNLKDIGNKVSLSKGEEITKTPSQKEKRGKGNKTGTTSKKQRQVTRTPIKKNTNKTSEYVNYSTPTNLVDRIDIGRKEIVQIDLTEFINSNMIKDDHINLKLFVIDGEGKTESNTIRLTDIYNSIEDLDNHSNYIIENNIIKNIKINNNRVHLGFNKYNNEINNLKFEYVLEVLK